MGRYHGVFAPTLSGSACLRHAHRLEGRSRISSASEEVMGGLPTVAAVVIGSAVANVGDGIMFPTMITWMLSELPPEARGRGSGLFVAASSGLRFANQAVPHSLSGKDPSP